MTDEAGPAAIELRGLGKRYGTSWTVRDLDLTIRAGETFVLIGESGCGKTTTLKMINRLVEPDAGEVLVNGVAALGRDASDLRRGIGYVIQDAGLFPHYTVRRNVGVLPELLGWTAARIRARVDELLEMVGLAPAEYGARYPAQLSGGQRQRVGIARALAADPPIVLLDEPFSALDPIKRHSIQGEFLALSERLGKTFVMVTHDIFEAVRLADRIGVMREGRLVQCAPPREIVANPADEFVAGMLGQHRYQLRMMTTTLAEAFGGDGDGDGAGAGPDGVRGKTVPMSPSASLWDALDSLESQRADFVQLAHGGGAGNGHTHRASPSRYLSRRDLFSSLGAS